MATMNRTTAVGVFRDRGDAEQALRALHDAGFGDDDIGFAWRGGDAPAGTTTHGETKSGEAAATGAVVGGLLGAAAALLIPGVGPAIAGGILAPLLGGGAATTAGAAAAGAVAGAATGGILGALVGLGIPEEEARYYEGEFQSGRIIMTVRAGGRYDEAASIMRRYGAYDVHNQPGMGSDTGTEPRRNVY
jgi:hypothetical protein